MHFYHLLILLVLTTQLEAGNLMKLDENDDADHDFKTKYSTRVKRNEIKEPLKCSFINSLKRLICNGINGKSVDCESSKVELNGSLPSFKLFGISSKPIGESFQLKFSLYPQNSNNAYFLDTQLNDKLLKRTIEYSIYFSAQYSDNGFRILKPICWKHLIDLITEMSVYSNSFSVIKETGGVVHMDTSVGRLIVD